MKSLSKMFGVIVSGVLMLAAPGCVVTDLEDPAAAQYEEVSWDEELLDDAVLDEAAGHEQGDGSGDEDYDVLDEVPSDDPWPDPFDPKEGTNGAGN